MFLVRVGGKALADLRRIGESGRLEVLGVDPEDLHHFGMAGWGVFDPGRLGYAVVQMSMTTAALTTLYSHSTIQARVAELGVEIDRDYAGQRIVLVGVLKGAAIFLADLARHITVDCTFDFVAVSSYGKGRSSSGQVKLIKDLDEPIEDRNVILVEDILDTGLTLNFLQKVFRQHHPRSLRVAALLDKPARRMEPIEADYVGFQIPNHFVVGYGMDFAEKYRNLKDICLFDEGAADGK